ncbi:MAG: hypothetical protein ACR2RA_00180 [Geminicoccaceae bacterium]
MGFSMDNFLRINDVPADPPKPPAKPKPTSTAVDASDRKFYVKAADNGNKQALKDFDAALAAQNQPASPKPAPAASNDEPKPHVKPERAADPSDQKFYNMAADRQNTIIDLENRAHGLNRDIDALGTSGGYATQAMQTELADVEQKLDGYRLQDLRVEARTLERDIAAARSEPFGSYAAAQLQIQLDGVQQQMTDVEIRGLERERADILDQLGSLPTDSFSGYVKRDLLARLEDVEADLRAQRRLPDEETDGPLFPEPSITPEQALITIRDNADAFDRAAGRGGDDGVIGIDDLREVADADSGFDPNLRAAAQYLLDNPRFFDRVEVANDGGGFRKSAYGDGDLRRDDKFSVGDIDRFLEQNEHLQVIYANTDALDIANAGHGADDNISRDDLRAIVDAEDEFGRPVHTEALREAARYLLDNDNFFEELETSNGDYNTDTDGDLTFGDLNAAILNRQVFASDPAAAQAFIMNGDAHLPGTNISDEKSIPSEGLRATAAAALSEASSLGDAVDLITHLPETKDGVRNDLITATYAEIATRYDGFLGDNSGANWSHWGVWASSAVGDVIRNEGGVQLGWTHGATGPQRTTMAEGNLLLYKELAPHLADFHQEFGNDAYPDQDRLDSFLERFGSDEKDFAQAFTAYYEARFETDPQRKQELTLVGNYHLVQHEQALVDEPLDKVLTDLPWYADIGSKIPVIRAADRAYEQIRVQYPGPDADSARDTSVVNDVPRHGEFPTAYDNHLVDLDAIQDDRIRDTIETYREGGGEGSPSADSLEQTNADEWHEYDERLYYIVQDWRLHHTDEGLLAVDDRGFGSIGWLS